MFVLNKKEADILHRAIDNCLDCPFDTEIFTGDDVLTAENLKKRLENYIEKGSTNVCSN